MSLPEHNLLHETLIQRKENAFHKIVEGCNDLGWTIVVPNAEDKVGSIDGLVIGTSEYIVRVLTTDEIALSDIYPPPE
jgi:hypothetical protein